LSLNGYVHVGSTCALVDMCVCVDIIVIIIIIIIIMIIIIIIIIIILFVLSSTRNMYNAQYSVEQDTKA